MAGDQTVREVPISKLPEAIELIGEEIVPIVQGGVTKYVNVKNFNSIIDKKLLNLDKVDNTPDADKPVSTAQRQALAEKANLQHSHAIDDVQGLSDALFNKANRDHGHNLSDVSGLPEALIARPTEQQVQVMIENAALGLDSSQFVKCDVFEW